MSEDKNIHQLIRNKLFSKIFWLKTLLIFFVSPTVKGLFPSTALSHGCLCQVVAVQVAVVVWVRLCRAVHPKSLHRLRLKM